MRRTHTINQSTICLQGEWIDIVNSISYSRDKRSASLLGQQVAMAFTEAASTCLVIGATAAASYYSPQSMVPNTVNAIGGVASQLKGDGKVETTPPGKTDKPADDKSVLDDPAFIQVKPIQVWAQALSAILNATGEDGVDWDLATGGNVGASVKAGDKTKKESTKTVAEKLKTDEKSGPDEKSENAQPKADEETKAEKEEAEKSDEKTKIVDAAKTKKETQKEHLDSKQEDTKTKETKAVSDNSNDTIYTALAAKKKELAGIKVVTKTLTTLSDALEEAFEVITIFPQWCASGTTFTNLA
jgi:outer membrane biosynthesis protein TonB